MNGRVADSSTLRLDDPDNLALLRKGDPQILNQHDKTDLIKKNLNQRRMEEGSIALLIWK